MTTTAEATTHVASIAYPIYLSLDVSLSMSPLLPDIMLGLHSTIDELQADDLICDVVRFALITFSDDAHLDIPLTPLAEIYRVPPLRSRGGTRYGPAFSLLRGEIRRDFDSLKRDGLRVARALVIFVTDGMPTDPESLENPWERLGRLEPTVIALSLSDTVDPAALNALVSRRGHAFVLRNEESNPAGAIMDTIRSSARSVTSSIVTRSKSVEFQQPLTVTRPPSSDDPEFWWR